MSASATRIDDSASFATYLDWPATHATALKDMLVSPLLYRWNRDHEKPDSDTFRVGRATHTAILQPELFLRDYVLWDEGIRRGKAWDAFTAKAAESGRTVLTRAQYELALQMQTSVLGHQVARRYVTDRERRCEVSLQWTHERTGIRCKSRLDLLACGALLDVKSARDISPRMFSASAARLGYALQMAMYRDACVASGLGLLPVKIVAVQNVEPYDVAVYELTDETLAIGSEQLERALDLLAECQRTNKWPGIAPDAEVPLVLPAWAAAEQDEQELTWNGDAL